MPIGENRETQTLLRVSRLSEGGFEEEALGAVRFVPPIGAQGWKAPVTRPAQPSVPHIIRESAQPLTGIEGGAFDDLLERIGDARVVLLGEATHGTSEFYRTRTEITKRLVCERGFRIVAVEADWPARVPVVCAPVASTKVLDETAREEMGKEDADDVC